MTEKEILPTFLGIGGQKCGTTWLHHYLAAHPDAFVPTKQKELCFFDARYKKYGRNGYLSFFKDAQAQKAVGEITPTYLWVSRRHSEWGAPNTFRNEVPERVMDFLGPDLKIVVLLRNPIQRAISAFLHNTKMKRVPMDAPIRPWLDKFGIVHMGFWGAHLARWTEVYSRDNFFVATYEDLFEKPETLVSLLNFIGLEPVDALKNKNSDKYQLSFPYRRDGDEFLHGDGRLIASEKDTQFIRDLYRPDVSLLKESWGLPADLWSQDF